MQSGMESRRGGSLYSCCVGFCTWRLEGGDMHGDMDA